MKILWFTNTECSAGKKLNLNNRSGGWLSSLEEEVNSKTKIDLSICFYSRVDIPPFKHGRTQFYPVYRHSQRSKIARLKNRLLPKSNEENELISLLNVVEMSNPDLIHIHGSENNFGLIQNKVKIPVVISMQGILNSISEKYFSGVPYSVVKKHEGILRKLVGGGIDRSYKVFLKNANREKLILKNAKHIMGRTDYDRRIARVLAPKSVYYIENEILRPAFYKVSWDKKKFSNSIQLVTTLSDGLYKGFDTVAQTSNILVNNTDIKFLWNVIGLKENAKIVKIVKNWKHLDIANMNIKFHGHLNEREIVQILLESDIYCQTSHIDNSPNSLSEAMMMGMPCIATFAGGTCSLLKDGQEGILVQEGDPWVLVGAILELSKNIEKAIRLGKNARKVANYRHDKTKIVNDLQDIYKKILLGTL